MELSSKPNSWTGKSELKNSTPPWLSFYKPVLSIPALEFALRTVCAQ